MKVIQKLGEQNIANGSWIDTHTLRQRTAGGDCFIRTKGGKVVGLALRPDLNPEAPSIVIVGKGPQKERRAEMLADMACAVPVYVKRDTNAWEYLGEYAATAYAPDKATIEKYRRHRKEKDVAGILFLEPAGDISVSVSGGRFADPDTRRKVELTAISFVTRALTRDGFEVRDDQSKNLGYDLLAVSPEQTLMIEVKGTDGPAPRFFITRGERRCSTNPSWRLAIVTNATRTPALSMLTSAEAEAQFDFDCLAWECTLKPKE